MARTTRAGRLAIWTFVTVAALAALGALAPVAVLRGFQWNLDVDQAMDAAGVRQGMIVGEAGAGDGYFTLPMARRVGAEGEVYANDISQRALSRLADSASHEGLTNVHTVVGAVDDPRFPRRDLELVVIVHAFHDFDKPVEWLVNLKRYLRPGAEVAIIDRDPARGAGSHFMTRERILDCATRAGYTLVRSTDAERDHLIVVIRPGTSGRGISPGN